MLTPKRRNIIFVEAAILTIAIYFFAIIFNGYLDTQRIEDLDYNLANSSVSLYNIEVSESFFENFKDDSNCKDRKKFIFDSFGNLKTIGKDLTNYGKLFLKSNIEHSKLRQREYFLRELLLYKKVLDYNEDCSEDKIVPVIYFFDSLSTELDKQSLILEQYYMNHENKTIVFSFDINFENEPILEEIKDSYDITSYPFIIIGNKTTRDLENNNGVVGLNTISIEYLRYIGELK